MDLNLQQYEVIYVKYFIFKVVFNLNDLFVYEFEICNGFFELWVLEVFYVCLKKIVFINVYINYIY